MSGQGDFDVIVIGGGAVGENVADFAVRGGLTAALVESELLGGECSYWACMPSKALLRTGHAVSAARRLPGVHAQFEPEAVLTRRDQFASHWHDDRQARWAKKAGITIVRGAGRVSGVRTVAVTDPDSTQRTLTARQAVAVCPGSVPVTPRIPGLELVHTWHSREATSAHCVPPRLGVLGGGVVGVEMAQAWASLGSQVTLLALGDRVLPSLEAIAGELVANGLRASGVDLRLHTGLDAVKPGSADGTIDLLFGNESLEVDNLLIATGRKPLTTGLGLDELGLPEDQALAVDDSGRVLGIQGGWLYAAGDVTGRAPLTHQGKYAARIAGAAIAARARGEAAEPVAWSEYAATANHRAVPQVVFTDPEVAFVGRTAEQATADGLNVRTVELDIAVAGSYLHAADYTGKACMVVNIDRDVLVGVTFVGPDTAEMLHAATIAIVGEVPMSRLWHAVPAFPTINEVWLRLLEAYRSES
jgi:dihydrolipoamide dehydrogenase